MIFGKAKFVGLVLLAGLMLGGIYYSTGLSQKNTEQRAKAAGESFPITGSFIMLDTNATKAQLELMMKEMKATGIDTVVIMASGGLEKTNGIYKETSYFTHPGNHTEDVMVMANQLGMDMYVGLAAYDYNVVNHWVGTADNPATDKGRIIDFSLRLANSLDEVAARNNIPASRLKGYYLGEYGPENLATPTVNELVFLKELAIRLKQKHSKKLLLSPYVMDKHTYNYMKSVYTNIYSQTPIDIIAPQDSMGSLKVTSFAKSAELFRALRDATVQFPGREAWANIETQIQYNVTNVDYEPSTIARVSGQIEAAKPYVTKSITWIYQHTMLSVPDFDNMYSFTGRYTQAFSVKRKKLRSDYMALYGPKQKMFYCDLGSRACGQTTSEYSETVTCGTNLGLYLSGKTTGVCYETAASCAAACTIPTSIPTVVPTAIPTVVPTDCKANRWSLYGNSL